MPKRNASPRVCICATWQLKFIALVFWGHMVRTVFRRGLFREILNTHLLVLDATVCTPVRISRHSGISNDAAPVHRSPIGP